MLAFDRRDPDRPKVEGASFAFKRATRRRDGTAPAQARHCCGRARREAAQQQHQHQHQHQHQLDENAFELLLEPDKDLDELVQEAAPAPLRAAAGVAPAALSGGASAAARARQRLSGSLYESVPLGRTVRSPAPLRPRRARASARALRACSARARASTPSTDSGAGVGVAQAVAKLTRV